jgi:hypothetical protein
MRRRGARYTDPDAQGGDEVRRRRVDNKRLSAGPGRIEFELISEKRKGRNIRIHTGDVCCFRPGSKDIGGTRTIGTGRTRAIVVLEPGIYTYLCSTGGYWRTQHGTLVVR